MNNISRAKAQEKIEADEIELYLIYQKLKENLDNIRRNFIENLGPIKFDDTDSDGYEILVYYMGKIVWKLEAQEEIDHTLEPHFQYVPLKVD